MSQKCELKIKKIQCPRMDWRLLCLQSYRLILFHLSYLIKHSLFTYSFWIMTSDSQLQPMCYRSFKLVNKILYRNTRSPMFVCFCFYFISTLFFFLIICPMLTFEQRSDIRVTCVSSWSIFSFGSSVRLNIICLVVNLSNCFTLFVYSIFDWRFVVAPSYLTILLILWCFKSLWFTFPFSFLLILWTTSLFKTLFKSFI